MWSSSTLGYPADFVELDQDLEGELGIDTVKQAEIMVDIRQHFNLPVDEAFVLSDHPTLNHMIGYIQKMQGGEALAPTLPPPTVEEPSEADVAEKEPLAETSTEPVPVSDEAMTQQVIDVVVKHTGYPADFIELDQDLEGELGIDTVKQAEIMVDIRQLFNLPVDEDFLLSDHPTLSHMIAYIVRMKGGFAPAPISTPTPIPEPVHAPVETPVAALPSDTGIQASLIEVVVKHTGYPADFIEMDQDLEGELGIDTVKQAEIMVDVREIFALPVDEDFLLSDHPTLNHFVAYIVRMKGGGQTAEPSPIVETAVEPQSLKSPFQLSMMVADDGRSRSNKPNLFLQNLRLKEQSQSPMMDGGLQNTFAHVSKRGLSTVRIGFEVGIRDVSIQSEHGRTVHRGDPRKSRTHRIHHNLTIFNERRWHAPSCTNETSFS